MEAEREQLRLIDCIDSFPADAVASFFAECAVTSTKNMTRESLVFSKGNSDVRKSYVFVAKFTAALTIPLTS